MFATTRRIVPARKRLFRTWVSTCAYHGIIFLHVICLAPWLTHQCQCEFGWVWDVVLPSWSEDCDKGESLIGPIFVVQEESWSWEVLAVSIFVIFMLSWCYLDTAYKNCSCGVNNTLISVLHCRLGLGVQPTVATGRRRESKEWLERRHCDRQQGWNQSRSARTYSTYSASVNRKHIPCCTWIYNVVLSKKFHMKKTFTNWTKAPKKRVGHCRLFCFQEGAPKAAPKFVSKMRACAKVFKCLRRVRWSVNGGWGCTYGQGPRNMLII